MTAQTLYQKAYKSLLELSTDEGINASGKDEIFGCIFGRDSFITILEILSAEQKYPNPELLKVCRNALRTLISLQGKEVNIESGEEPGKFIHEYRKDKHEHLTQGSHPWYVYPDGTMKSYDTVDSTPLALLAIHKYWEVTHDIDFLGEAMSAVKDALHWILSFGDKDGDLLLEFEFDKKRKHGGLVVQSWTDSRESFTKADGSFTKYPIAPVEVQGYAWCALKVWARFFLESSKGNYALNSLKDRLFGETLEFHAEKLKDKFNKSYIYKDRGLYFAAQALDGDKKRIEIPTGNVLILLWAAAKNEEGEYECIVEEDFIPDLVKRAFQKDMFDSDAGIRTMSSLSPTFNPNPDSYHNGSFWPVLNGLCWEGLLHFRYNLEAEKLQNATLKALRFFGEPVELFNKTFDGKYTPFISKSGQTSCRVQAWSAGVQLNMTAKTENTVVLEKEFVEVE